MRRFWMPKVGFSTSEAGCLAQMPRRLIGLLLWADKERAVEDFGAFAGSGVHGACGLRAGRGSERGA